MTNQATIPDDDTGLADKVAIVTGGGAVDDGIGNGRAAPLLLARGGARVVVDRLLEAAMRTVAMIGAEGGVAVALAVEVTHEEQCRAMVAATLERFGRLDFLDNNVGMGGRGSVVDQDPDDWRRIM